MCLTGDYINNRETDYLDRYRNMRNRLENDVTRNYLEENRNLVIDHYVNSSLVFDQIEFVKENHPKRISSRKTRCLVLLVGYSPEPLLQSMLVYEPEVILLLINERQDGGPTSQQIEAYMRSMICSMYRNWTERNSESREYPEIIAVTLEKDTSEAVFQKLNEQWKHFGNGLSPTSDKHSVVIDITGGKKSMISGAYLFAAYYNFPISYVDFEKYEPATGRPFGYTCSILPMENPYRTFRLAEWHAIERAYSAYSFSEALRLLDDNIKGGDETGFYDKCMLRKLRVLREVLSMYALWDSNDYIGAKIKFDESLDNKAMQELSVPLAICRLGDVKRKSWPNIQTHTESENGKKNDKIKQGITKVLDSLRDVEIGFAKDGKHVFYNNKDGMLLYAKDELEKIKRLVNRPKMKNALQTSDVFSDDWRSALIRSANLVEFIFRAVLFSQILCDDLKISTEKVNEVNYDNKGERTTTAVSSDLFDAYLLEMKTTCTAELGKYNNRFIFIALQNGKIERNEMVKILCGQGGSTSGRFKMKDGNGKKHSYEFYLSLKRKMIRSTTEQLETEFGESIKCINDLAIKNLNDYRNATSHTFLPVNHEMALEAIGTAETVFQSLCKWYFAGNEQEEKLSEVCFQASPWNDLIKKCELPWAIQSSAEGGTP